MTSLEGRERSSDEEGGLASQGEGEAERGASETAAVSPGEIAAGPQPPYDDDFNPFSEEDIKRILHEEECSDPKEGWKFVSHSEFTEVWRKSDPSKPVHLVKAFLHFPGIPPNIVSDLIHNIERRLEWDSFFSTLDIIEEHKNFRVVYWVAKMPLFVADRDLVQFICRQRDEDTNTVYFLYRNATHPKAPLRRGLVRAETILSGLVLRPDPQDPGSTRMSIMIQTDIKGWIPHMVVNAFAARSPKQWHTSLTNFYQNVYSKELQEAGGGEGGGGGAQEGRSED